MTLNNCLGRQHLLLKFQLLNSLRRHVLSFLMSDRQVWDVPKKKTSAWQNMFFRNLHVFCSINSVIIEDRDADFQLCTGNNPDGSFPL